MRDLGACLAEQADIVGHRIADETVAGEIDRMRQDSAGVEHALVGKQLHRRFAGLRHRFEELAVLLDEMHREGHAERARQTPWPRAAGLASRRSIRRGRSTPESGRRWRRGCAR